MKQSHVGGIALLVCLIVVVAIALVSCAQDGTGSPAVGDNTPPLVIGDTMTVLVTGAASLSDLAAAGIPAPEELQIPKGIKRYDVVAFDHAALSREIRDGFPLSIHGMAYRAEQHGMNFEQIDDGINTYEGVIVGVDESDILLTIGNVLDYPGRAPCACRAVGVPVARHIQFKGCARGAPRSDRLGARRILRCGDRMESGNKRLIFVGFLRSSASPPSRSASSCRSGSGG